MSLIGVCISLLAACGRLHETISALQDEAPRGSLLVLMGGHNSCAADGAGSLSPYGLGSYPQFHTLVSRLAASGAPTRTFMACYDRQDRISYVKSDTPNMLYSTLADNITNPIRGQIAEEAPANVYLIGHSYGGWLGMQTALSLQQQVRTIGGLYTIDPISPNECSFWNPFGCTSAPSDFSATDLNSLGTNNRSWINFFENETLFLHSSAIPQAHSNYQIAAAHVDMDTDPSIWSIIDADIP